MSFGLVRCAYNHVFPLAYVVYVRRHEYNRLDTTSHKCLKCSSTRLYLITDYDPLYEMKNLVVGTFGEIRWKRLSNMLNAPEDSIRKVLSANNYVVNDLSNDGYIVYTRPNDDTKVIFQIEGNRKTQTLIILAPSAKDEIVKKIIEANKFDKRAKRATAKPKPVLPTSYKDFLGEELTIGDWVAYATFNYTNLQTGRITKINEKSVSLTSGRKSRSISKSSGQIVKLSKERAVLLSLEL